MDFAFGEILLLSVVRVCGGGEWEGAWEGHVCGYFVGGRGV